MSDDLTSLHHRYLDIQMDRFLSEDERRVVMCNFEKLCMDIQHGFCRCCRMVSTDIRCNADGYCIGHCSSLKDKNFYLSKRALPIWKSGETVMYNVPDCLKNLSQAEKLLIQRISPFVPMHHLKNGVFGLTGHCCAFESDIEKFVNCLPRQRTDVTMLKVLKTVLTEICGNKATVTKAFMVRKKKVYDALVFLKQHHKEYAEIQIDMSALDWLNGEEGVIDCHILETDEILTSADDTVENADLGPSPSQRASPDGDSVGIFGFITENDRVSLSERDSGINKSLQESVEKSPSRKQIVVNWPELAATAVDEFCDTRMFVNAFPWLFPGGIGDPKDYPGSLAKWGKHMLYYEDGRFATDSIFSFFATNHIVRMRNAGSGQWFIDNFQKNCPETLEDLKDSIEMGETSFVNSLTYYSQSIR